MFDARCTAPLCSSPPRPLTVGQLSPSDRATRRAVTFTMQSRVSACGARSAHREVSTHRRGRDAENRPWVYILCLGNGRRADLFVRMQMACMILGRRRYVRIKGHVMAPRRARATRRARAMLRARAMRKRPHVVPFCPWVAARRGPIRDISPSSLVRWSAQLAEGSNPGRARTS